MKPTRSQTQPLTSFAKQNSGTRSVKTSTASAVSPAPRLRRSLTLWDLILYGIIVIQPTAPMPAYGVFSNAGQGHVVTSILIAMVAMVFTAMSYGRMARVYPSAGSAYTYVGRELHPSLGYVTGWSMTLDYIVNPLICTVWSAKAMADLLGGTHPPAIQQEPVAQKIEPQHTNEIGQGFGLGL